MRAGLLLSAAVAATLFYRLGDIALIGPDESHYAQVAWEMLERGDWVTPHLMGRPWLDKPPLYYWTAALSLHFFGENELAARLPSALASLVTIVSVFFLGARLADRTALSPSGAGVGPRARNRKTGFLSALVLTTSFGLTVYGRAAIPDALLMMSLTLGLGAYVIYAKAGVPAEALREGGSLPWLAASFACFGLATLAKGPVGLILPIAILSLYERRLPRVKPALVAAGAFLAVALPWHVAILRTRGWEWVEVFLFEHNLDRFFTTIHRHPGPIYYYVPILAFVLFPWATLFPLAVYRGWKASRFVLLWIAVPFLFFSLAGSKLPGYMLPVLPPAALLIGALLAEEPPSLKRAIALHPILCGMVSAAVLYGFSQQRSLSVLSGIPLALLSVALGVVALVAVRRSIRAGWITLGSGSLVFLLFALHQALPLLEPLQSIRALTSEATERLVGSERIVCYKAFYHEAIFYCRGRIEEIWTLEEFERRTRERGRILTLTDKGHYYNELRYSLAIRTTLLGEEGVRVLVEVRPAQSGF